MNLQKMNTINLQTFLEKPEFFLTLVQNGKRVCIKNPAGQQYLLASFADPEQIMIQFLVEPKDYNWLRNYQDSYMTEMGSIIEDMLGALSAYNDREARINNNPIPRSDNLKELSIWMKTAKAESLGLINNDPATRGAILHNAILYFKRIVHRCICTE